jgi:hypothetical protein
MTDSTAASPGEQGGRTAAVERSRGGEGLIQGTEGRFVLVQARTPPLFELSSSTSPGNCIALGELRSKSLHPHPIHTYAYLLDMVGGHRLVDGRVAGEPNAICGIGMLWNLQPSVYLEPNIEEPPYNPSSPITTLVSEYHPCIIKTTLIKIDFSTSLRAYSHARVVAYVLCTAAIYVMFVSFQVNESL